MLPWTLIVICLRLVVCHAVFCNMLGSLGMILYSTYYFLALISKSGAVTIRGDDPTMVPSIMRICGRDCLQQLRVKHLTQLSQLA